MRATSEELRQLKPIVVAVVGPTNEGKTSVLRTLTSDPTFGMVNAYNGTTARAEIQKVFYNGVAEILQLIDTPGFQTSNEIVDLLAEDEDVALKDGAFDVSDVLRVIPKGDDEFEHDLRAWREVARCDVVIFVVSVAENPNQSLLKNTLRLLKNVGKPIVVAYNNVKDEGTRTNDKKDGETGGEKDDARVSSDYRKDWDETLRKNGFFLVQKYDAHRRSFADEVALLEKIAATTRDALTQRVLRLEIGERRASELRRLSKSREILAEAFVDVAAYRECAVDVAREEWKMRLARLEETLKQTILKREHDAQVAILETWGFRLGVLNREMLNVDDDANESDQRLDANAKRRLKVGASLGGGLGFIVDAACGFATLGTGTALGALLGGGGGAAYSSKYDPKTKKLSARPQKQTLYALLGRGVELAQKLQTRGMALEDASQTRVPTNPRNFDATDFEGFFAECARRGELSNLNRTTSYFDRNLLKRLPGVAALTKEEATREEIVRRIAEKLKSVLPDVEEI